MTASTMTYTGTLTVLECGECHIRFAMPVDLYNQLQARPDGGTFWCPRGCKLRFLETEVTRLRKKLATAEFWRDNAETRARAAQDQADTAERRRRAAKGQVTKMRNRVKAGVCPVDGCKRHFANLASHMETKHPGYAAEQHADE